MAPFAGEECDARPVIWSMHGSEADRALAGSPGGQVSGAGEAGAQWRRRQGWMNSAREEANGPRCGACSVNRRRGAACRTLTPEILKVCFLRSICYVQ